MNDLKGKRLLLLGGSTWKDAIKNFATEHGIILIAAAPYHVGIFDIADESHLLDVTDANVMIPFIRENNIDGVYMGGSEPVISEACHYLADLKLPCYCTKEQWEGLQNKKYFKQLCIKHGLPVVPMYDVKNDNIDEISKSLPFPVITKPVDSCGSSGFSVCHNKQELKAGYAKAVSSSPTGSVITERYVKNDAVIVFYTFCNGEVIFSGLEDKYPIQLGQNTSFVGGFFVYNSKWTELFRQRYESKITNLVNDLCITQGSAWIEVFRQDDEFFFNEVGFRYGGSVSIYPIDYFFHINQIANDICYSLTGSGQAYNHNSLTPHKMHEKKYYGVYPLYAKSGTISFITGFEHLINQQEIIFATLTKKINSVIKNTGDFSQNVGLVHFVFDTIAECEKTIGEIHRVLSLKDKHNNEMLLKLFPADILILE